ncbi:MAG: peptide deformylase [Thermoflexales bacterium]|nr:peptide deformylase [Thermoflexales bacterium]
MIREIKTLKDPVLRKTAHKIEKVTPELRKLIEDLFETMHAHNGVGLAAPQVGISKRLFVVEVEAHPEIPGSGVRYALINPEITQFSPEREVGQEGCLSIPGWRGDVERATRVVVRGMDGEGKRIKLEVEGYVARAMQHELDHLDGVLFIDKLIAPDRIWRVNESEDEETV